MIFGSSTAIRKRALKRTAALFLAVFAALNISACGKKADIPADLGKTAEGSALSSENPAAEPPLAAESENPAQEASAPVSESEQKGKTLVVYFSWSDSKNTEKMAELIQQQTGGDLLKLEPLTPYPANYNECTETAKAERDQNARPQIANLPDSLSEYDTVFVGYPIWWHTAPMIIGTFLEQYDLFGIELFPFVQSASMDSEHFENSMEFVRETASGASVHDGLFADSSDSEAILAYLSENGFGD